MTWSRRQFLTGVGVLAAVSGTAGRVVAKTLNINGVRYGMVHDESLCIRSEEHTSELQSR